MSAAPAHTTFQHEALLYDGLEDLVTQAAPFVREGVEAGEPVMVALTRPKLDALAAALGPAADAVQLVDIRGLGRNPARLLPALQRFVDDRAPGGAPARILGEPLWPGRDADELAECAVHEALVNLAFAGRSGLRLRCPYDLDAVEPAAVHAARCTHDVVIEGGVAAPGRVDPGVARPGDGDTLPPPPAGFDALPVERRTLREARALVARRATEAGLPGWRVQDAVRAVHELAANSVRHGGGRGVLRIWRTPDALVCEVRDRGHITDPLAGRRRPAAEASGGRGLWVATQLADLLQIRTGPRGSAVRLVMRLD
jgi:anti-sigma regulatory factor (Ser/Thr protein kinase)